MGRRPKDCRVELFEQLAADLSTQLIGKEDVIQCPLSLQGLGRENIDAFTEEHVILESAGGSEVTLSCKPHNRCECGGSHRDVWFRLTERAVDGADSTLRQILPSVA